MTQPNAKPNQSSATDTPETDAAHAGAPNPETNRAANPARTQMGGKGMPARTPDDVPLEREPENSVRATLKDQSDEAALELPNDRDQATDMTANAPDPMIQQAAQDVKQGKKDTSKALETDRTYEGLRKG